MLYHQWEMTSLVSAGLAKTLENRMWKLLSLSLSAKLLTWRCLVRWEVEASCVDLCCSTMSCQRWKSCAKVMFNKGKQTKWGEVNLPKVGSQMQNCFGMLYSILQTSRVSEAESADGITHPSRYWSHFMSAFSGSYTSFVWKDTPLLQRVAGASRIKGTPKGIRSSSKHYIYNITELWHWWYYRVF